MLNSEDASDFEGALRNRENYESESKLVRQKSVTESDFGQIGEPSNPKAGWGSSNTGGASGAIDPSSIPAYNFDEDEDEPTFRHVEDEELIRQVADAPEQALEMQSLLELDKNTEFALPTGNDGEMSLSVLTSVLTNQKEIEENDVTWTFDGIFVEVVSEFEEKNRLEKKVQEMKRMDELASQSKKDINMRQQETRKNRVPRRRNRTTKTENEKENEIENENENNEKQ